MEKKKRKINGFIKFGIVLGVMNLLLLTGCVNAEQNYGSFFDLQTAYEDKLISEEDVKVIAANHNNKLFGIIQSDEEIKVKKAYAAQFPSENSTYKDVVIEEFLGEYNNCLAMIVRYADTNAAAEYNTLTIGDAEIRYGNGLRIVVYKKV